MKSKGGKILLYVIVIVMLLSFALKFDIVSNFVAGMFGTTPEVVHDWGDIIFYGSIGVFLISSGVATMAVPFVGVILIGIGVAMLGIAIWTKARPTPTLSED